MEIFNTYSPSRKTKYWHVRLDTGCSVKVQSKKKGLELIDMLLKDTPYLRMKQVRSKKFVLLNGFTEKSMGRISRADYRILNDMITPMNKFAHAKAYFLKVYAPCLAACNYNVQNDDALMAVWAQWVNRYPNLDDLKAALVSKFLCGERAFPSMMQEVLAAHTSFTAKKRIEEEMNAEKDEIERLWQQQQQELIDFKNKQAAI